MSVSAKHDPVLKNFSLLKGRIGIFGGTFDPLHIGHIEAAKRTMLTHQLDAVVFIPAGQNPLKANAPKAPNESRLQMLIEALKDEEKLFVSPIQLCDKGPSYTIDLLKKIREQIDVQSSLYLIVGADCLPSFNRWVSYREILALSTLLPVARPSSNEQPIELSADTPEEIKESLSKLVSLNIDISSRELRKALSQGQIPANQLPPQVSRFLQKDNPYKQALT